MISTSLRKVKNLVFRPFFSIVIPTRDRPEFIELGLELILAQSYSNFEVIVSDNATSKPCKDIVDKFNDHRVRYVRPSSALGMAEHWEFACAHARGKYVSVLIDKTFLHTEALSVLYGVLSRKRYDLVSWSNETFVPIQESEGYRKGFYSPQYVATAPIEFCPEEELESRMSCEKDLWNEGKHYFRGKICFGAFSKKLIKKIIKKQGRLFHNVCPDYTATASALALAKNAVDIGQPLMASYLTSISNGMNYYRSPSYAREFLMQVDPSGLILNELPIEQLYASTHNLIAGDYLRVKRQLGNKIFPQELNVKNLEQRIVNDLAVAEFESSSALESQVEFLLASNSELDKEDMLEKINTEKEKRSLTGNQDEKQTRAIYEAVYTKYDSPLDMAKAMAAHYEKQLAPAEEDEEQNDGFPL